MSAAIEQETVANCRLALIEKCSLISQKHSQLFDRNLVGCILAFHKPLTDVFNEPFATESVVISDDKSLEISYESWNIRKISGNYIEDRPDVPTEFTGYPKAFVTLQSESDCKTSQSESDDLPLDKPRLQRQKYYRTQILQRSVYVGKFYWWTLLPWYMPTKHMQIEMPEVWDHLMGSLE
jgi:hypothetical protein